MPPKQQSGKGQGAAFGKAPPGADQQGDMSAAGQKGKRQTLKNLSDKAKFSGLGRQALAKVSTAALKVRSRRPAAARSLCFTCAVRLQTLGKTGHCKLCPCCAAPAAGGGCRTADRS